LTLKRFNKSARVARPFFAVPLTLSCRVWVQGHIVTVTLHYK